MKSILVLGMGLFGRSLAKRLQELGNEVMVVDKDEEHIDLLNTMFEDIQIGNYTNEEVIKSLGVNTFDICFVCIGGDILDSLEVTSLLKENGAKLVVAKARKPKQAEFLKKIGADEVIFPELEIAEKTAIRYNAKNIFNTVELTSEYSIYEIPIVPEWTGKTIVDINVRRKYNINIIAIKNGNALQPVPSADYKFNYDDHIVVIGKATDVFKLTSKT